MTGMYSAGLRREGHDRDGQAAPEMDGPADLQDACADAPGLAIADHGLRAGARLAAARARKNLTLKQASELTRLNPDYLAALEAMNLKLLPGKAYARAYLKSYAQLLGLDPAEMIAQFETENALSREDVNPQIRNPASKPRRERPWLAAALILALGGGFAGWRIVGSGADPRFVQAEAPTLEQPSAAPAPRPAASAQVELRAVKSAWLEVRGPDGTIFISQTLEPGQAYRPDVGAGWTIHARDAAAFEVFVAGQSVGPLGGEGAPVLGRQVDDLPPKLARDAASAAEG